MRIYLTLYYPKLLKSFVLKFHHFFISISLHNSSRSTFHKLFMNPIFEIFDSSLFDDELALNLVLSMEEKCWGSERGSTSRHNSIMHPTFIQKNYFQGHQWIFSNYCAESLVYHLNLFCRRFWMQHSLFLYIQAALKAYKPYFVEIIDAARRLGRSSIQKITAAMRIPAYGVYFWYFVDKYLRIVENVAAKCLKKFLKAVNCIFSSKYLFFESNTSKFH